MKGLSLLAALVVSAVTAGGQEPVKPAARDTVDKTFFTRRDLVVAAGIVGASAVVSIFDQRIRNWSQSDHVQGGDSRRDLVDALTVVNETPLTLGAFATYGVGRLIKNETVADVGLHATETLVLTVVLAEAIRGPVGRVRPRASPDDPFHFKAFEGFSDFAARSYPSMHAAVAFAAATALTGEIRLRAANAVKYAAPPLYAAALIPGFTRIYLDQHWASDIVAGAAMGTLLGAKVVRYAHTHSRSRLDRFLLATTIAPDTEGNVRIGVAFAR